MKTKILIVIFSIVGFLIFCPQMRAQAVDGYTSIDYDDSTGLIDAYSETSLDYDVECYYQAYVYMRVYDDSGYTIVTDWDQDYSGFGFISVEDLFYADSGTTYTADGTHSAYATYYDYDYDWDWDYGRYRTYYYYYDVWFFGFYEGYYIYEPWYYYFINPYGFQPQRTRRTPRVRTGTTHDSAQVSTPSLKPHHLLVDVDQYSTNDCQSVRRDLRFKVQTQSNRFVTDASVRETFPPPHNTCTDQDIHPSDNCRPLDPGGTFQDALSVTCPADNSTCGFSMRNQWQWCPPSGAPITIGTLNNDVRKYTITINGSEHFTPGVSKIFRR
jgi:hypothetical protein